MHSILICMLLLACATAQYTSPVELGPSTQPAPVTAASVAKVQALATDMYNRWYALDQVCDPRSVFAVAYLFMTANARRLISNNYFDDGNKMADFIINFAKRYTDAYDAYVAGNMSAVSEPWQQAFNFALGNHSDVTEDITLGMNAHINYDLAIATFQSGYAVPAWTADYYRVNDLMNQIDVNITTAIGRYDPLFYNQDFLSQAYFTGSVQLVTSWRTSAYATAVSYQGASPVPVLGGTSVDTLIAASKATAVLAAAGISVPYPTNTQPSRYAYCMTQNQIPIGI